MTRTSTTRLENRNRRGFSPPRLRAPLSVQSWRRRGISEAQARKVYLDYLNRSKPLGNRGQRKAA